MVALTENLNSTLKKRMTGTIVYVLDKDNFYIEFVKKDGRNIEVDGEFVFAVTRDQIKKVWPKE